MNDTPMPSDSSFRVMKARTRLLLENPWFGSLAMRLRIEETNATPTFSVDGTTLKYNPNFAAELSESELVGTWAHEVMHCALLHPFRIAGRDLRRWNEAADFCINSLLLKQGFTLPEGILHEERFDAMGADQIYAIRDKEQREQMQQPQPQEQPERQDGDQQGQGSPTAGDEDGDQAGDAAEGQGEVEGGQQSSPTGDFTQPAQGDGTGSAVPESEQMTDTDWQVAAEQATAVAKKAGRMPGDVDRAVKSTHESEEDWRSTLRRFIEQTTPSDYSWSMPNRRYISAGLYLPGVVRENFPRFVVAIDTSGSIDQRALDIFAGELNAILRETRPEAIDVLYCDTRIQHTETFTPDDSDALTLNAIGGGGTLFAPVFDHVAENYDEPPAALLFFTDLENGYEEIAEPDYPVLWITDKSTQLSGPFGETTRLSAWAA